MVIDTRRACRAAREAGAFQQDRLAEDDWVSSFASTVFGRALAGQRRRLRYWRRWSSVDARLTCSAAFAHKPMLIAMGLSLPAPMRGCALRSTAAGLLLASLALCAPAASRAALSKFGSTLSVPASKDTANDLNYTGNNVMLPGSVFHVSHDGADTSLWNVELAGVPSAAPASGQIVELRLEGCAKQPQGAPPPLTQIHFQDLVPRPGGGVTVNVSTQAFEIPVCGQNGASGSTVTTYAPTNFCVTSGDYVDFSDEGGFVPSSVGPPPYPSGVPYMVIGAASGATMSSFIRNNGVGNGATFSPSDTSYHDGVALNPGEELMLQATLATGADATPLCPGGTQGVHARRAEPALPPIRISPQTDGVNRSRVVSIAIYCRPAAGCPGTATLSGRAASYGSTSFGLRGNKTGHVRIRVNQHVIAAVRSHHQGIPAVLTVSFDGQTFTQAIGIRL
jgi:hypothetical protein